MPFPPSKSQPRGGNKSQTGDSGKELSPTGVPSKYFENGSTPKSKPKEENASLASITSTMQKCEISQPRLRWRLAIRMVLDRKYVFELANKDMERPYVVFMRERATRHFPSISVPQYLMLNSKQALLVSIIIQSILSLPYESRTRRHLDLLDDVLKRHSIIGKYTKELRFLLYDMMSYQVFPANKFITVQGREAQNQYLILTGIARLQSMPPVRKGVAMTSKKATDTANARQPISISFLSAGDSFGEFAAIKESEYRPQNVSVVAATQLHVLAFEKRLFSSIILDLENKFTEKQQWLNSLPGFKTLSR